MGWILYGVVPLVVFLTACCLPAIFLKGVITSSGEGAMGKLGLIGGLVCLVFCIGSVSNMVLWVMSLVWLTGDDCIDSNGVKCY